MNEEIKNLEQKIKDHEAEEDALKKRFNREKNKLGYMSARKDGARTHRLITRGAAIESIIPQIQELDEQTFYNVLSFYFRDDTKKQEFILAVNTFLKR